MARTGRTTSPVRKRAPAQRPDKSQSATTADFLSKTFPSINMPLWAKWGRRLFLLSGWLMSLFVGILDLPGKIVSFSEKAPVAREAASGWVWDYKRYEGRFSSDPGAWKEKNLIGTGEPQVDEGEIQLDIAYGEKGHFSGEIHSQIMAEKFFAPWSRVMISGEVGVTGTFRGEVWDVVANEKALYTRFHLTIDDPQKGTLRLTPLYPNDGVFPGEVVLWPTDHAMSDGMPGKKFREALARAIEERRKPNE